VRPRARGGQRLHPAARRLVRHNAVPFERSTSRSVSTPAHLRRPRSLDQPASAVSRRHDRAHRDARRRNLTRRPRGEFGHRLGAPLHRRRGRGSRGRHSRGRFGGRRRRGQRRRRCGRWRGRGSRLGRRRRRWHDRIRRRGRKKQQRVDVALRVVRTANAEVDVGHRQLGHAARPDGTHDVTFDNRDVAADGQGAEVEQRRRETALAADRERLAARRHRPGERDDAARRSDHCGSRGRADVEPAMLARGIRIRAEAERPQHRALNGPRPAGRPSGPGERDDPDARDAFGHHRPYPLPALQTAPTVPGHRARCQI
jgi:hypothetical protein